MNQKPIHYIHAGLATKVVWWWLCQKNGSINDLASVSKVLHCLQVMVNWCKVSIDVRGEVFKDEIVRVFVSSMEPGIG